MAYDPKAIVFIGIEAALRDRLSMIARKHNVSMREIIRRGIESYKREAEMAMEAR